MGGGKKTPAVAQTAVCRRARSCHVHGKGIRKFGKSFAQPLVAQLASSSVVILDGSKRVASGTLIHPNVVLCAAHTALGLSKIEILIWNECTAKTAPPGDKSQYAKDRSKWSACSLEAQTPQAVEIKTLESGDPSKDFDYALLAIEWKNTKDGGGNTKIVELPHIPILPTPSSTMSAEVLLVGHPWITPGQHQTGEPAQASAGKLYREDGPNSETGKGSGYGYADFFAIEGSSGGGVFNQQGRMVGVLKGKGRVEINTERNGVAGVEKQMLKSFLNLGRVAAARPKSRIGTWLSQGQVLKTGDPDQNVVFKPA